jgi:hypothetical protein
MTTTMSNSTMSSTTTSSNNATSAGSIRVDDSGLTDVLVSLSVRRFDSYLILSMLIRLFLFEQLARPGGSRLVGFAVMQFIQVFFFFFFFLRNEFDYCNAETWCCLGSSELARVERCLHLRR